jgi:hypothetical protein
MFFHIEKLNLLTVKVPHLSGSASRSPKPPELSRKIASNREERQSIFTVKNIGKLNAYQVEIYLHDEGDAHEVIIPAPPGTEIGVLSAGEERVVSCAELRFESCFGSKQYWLEYEDGSGNQYRLAYQVTSIGKSYTFPPKSIKRRNTSLVRVEKIKPQHVRLQVLRQLVTSFVTRRRPRSPVHPVQDRQSPL